MMNYDSKLGEWFKQLEKQKEEFKARKHGTPAAEPAPEPVSMMDPQPAAKEVASARMPVPTTGAAERQTPEAVSAAVATEERTADISSPRIEHAEVSPALFDETDASPIEDFLSVLSRSREREPEVQEHVEPPRDQGLLILSEGTGEPRPITPAWERDAGVVAAPPAVDIPAPPTARNEPAAAKPAPMWREATPAEDEAEAEEKFGRLPGQLQSLLESAGDEVAQHSYKTFRESRASLIQRHLDPPITLEETARILNVCPTTVRRYTNRGILRHYRTAGNQRRFKLSEVLTFMESNLRTSRGPSAPETDSQGA